MRKALKVLLAALMLSLPAVPQVQYIFNAVQNEQHRSMHEIVMVERDDKGKVVKGALCTAYAVGPHTLLTAEHCNLDTDSVYIDPASSDAIKKGTAQASAILDREYDHEDHMLLDVTNADFTDVSVITPGRVPVQGEHVYFWGNPGGARDQYREGVVMGSIPYGKDQAAQDGADVDGGVMYTVQMPTIGGDSGSAVFSQRDNEIVGLVTFGIDDGQIAGIFPLEFTGAQVTQALK